MHKINNVAVLYAKILFEKAMKLSIISKVKQDLKSLNKFNQILEKHNISLQLISLRQTNLIDFISSIYQFNSLTHLLLKLLQNKNRLDYLSSIIIEFNAQVRNYEGITLGYLITAVKWSRSAINDAKTIFERKLKRKFVLSNIVDKSITGGVILRYDNYEYDFSILGAINRIKSRIKSNYQII
ncbi:ATP synthase F1, delta subunit [Orientia chuto str. Dubai]|uniref:ATP synthase subunit delta n=1 Tax=Orientia chuto str. Dubai TaxID=1359168 RepID=A0A0F3MQN4_9RICK|nr:ATP synthase F1 subunit delta [Candidatus Orientia mediorientalis]KJV56919.1 ATP synthase F1, delta subunit [Orientia chuto str. Dubai]